MTQDIIDSVDDRALKRMEDDAIPLTVFLMRPEKVTEFAKAFLVSAQRKLKLRPPLKGVFIPLPGTSKPPDWVPAVEELLGHSIGPGMESQSPSGMLVLNRKTGTFVITFGHAAQRLKSGWPVEEFGRCTNSPAGMAGVPERGAHISLQSCGFLGCRSSNASKSGTGQRRGVSI